MDDISSDLQKLLKYLNGTTIVALFRIPFAMSVFLNSLALYLKDLKSLKLVAPSLK